MRRSAGAPGGAARGAPGCRLAPIVFAAITIDQILEILLLIVVVHVVLLAPVMVAVVRTYLEYQENQAIRRQRGSRGVQA